MKTLAQKVHRSKKYTVLSVPYADRVVIAFTYGQPPLLAAVCVWRAEFEQPHTQHLDAWFNELFNRQRKADVMCSMLEALQAQRARFHETDKARLKLKVENTRLNSKLRHNAKEVNSMLDARRARVDPSWHRTVMDAREAGRKAQGNKNDNTAS